MEYQINDVPFEMDQISAKLFNNQFLSDVTFVIEDKHIYAHSLELMKRSTVFQTQIESTLGEKKIIPITDFGYNVFYEFIRFIYTDEFNGVNRNCKELLKLANTYKVIRLVNVLLPYINTIEKLDFCITENHKIALNDTRLETASRLEYHLKSKEFISIQPDTIEEILNFDQITKDVKETDLLDALVRWVKHHDHQQLGKLINLVRFPTMSTKQLRDTKTKYSDLLTDSQFLNIAGQKIYGDGYENGLWNCIPRKEFISPYEYREFPRIFEFKTKFTVSSDLILGGIVLGTSSRINKRIAITISCNQPQLNDETEVININTRNVGHRTSSVTSLGTSIRIHPKFTYVIDYKFIFDSIYYNMEKNYWCRKPETELIINGPPNTVKILEAHGIMHEIMFLDPKDDNNKVNK